MNTRESFYDFISNHHPDFARTLNEAIWLISNYASEGTDSAFNVISELAAVNSELLERQELAQKLNRNKAKTA